MNKPKIKISYDAYKYLLKALEDCKDFNCIRLKFITKCCGTKVDIILSHISSNDICDKIDDLNLVYDNVLLNNVKEIIITYKNSSLAIKHTTIEGLFPKEKKCCKKNKDKTL